MRWTLPNILTVARLAAAPGVAIIFLILPRPFADWAALILFVTAAVTDWLDGYLARLWKQHSRFGAMLDPIADKAMVIIALATLMGLYGFTTLLILPVAAILFREVFVSGLREFLGNKAGSLQVTKLAKWKTTVQMIAIAVLFSYGIFEHHFGMNVIGMSPEIVRQIMSGEIEDEFNLILLSEGAIIAYRAGLVLLWLAAALTVATGVDYLVKAMPHLKEDPHD
ncbi:CDP-diacylglycerol--glycerol-3-phosphate 3-phosphatidyltransferase [Nioella nitratireducens]|uniref:CDP-diacylglycerol--glycerol-3-phosphate 3-phosphatidyltransferase n=1 Tax=Nioella nitratireducens TaxID=1287720 RepID=UPI0008FD0A2F|nr:CDP-diacylglycerol--glycerol-3-phosphate 3-phosphatidyltransferase [Nioella nitratireducens]